jgi:hypothetical protein
MLLHDVDGEAIDRILFLSSARGIAGVVKLWVRQMKIDALEDQRNPKLTNRHKNGLAGAYVLNPLYWTVDRLVRCSTLLRRERMEKGAWARQSTSKFADLCRGGGVRGKRKDDRRRVQIARAVLPDPVGGTGRPDVV